MNKTIHSPRGIAGLKLQIQPQYASRDTWASLAKEEGLTFEVLELSMPAALEDDARYQKCLDWYRGAGLCSSVHGAFLDMNPVSGDPAVRTLSRQRYEESCRIALALGAENVVYHATCFAFLRGVYMEKWAAQYAEFLQELAEKYPLKLFVENSQDIDADPIRELMNHISVPEIGVCLDLGHANYSRIPLRQWFESLGDRIGYLHLSDNIGIYDDHLPLGDGTVDWAQVNALWKDLGREVPATLEVGGPEGVRKSLRYLREHNFFGM